MANKKKSSLVTGIVAFVITLTIMTGTFLTITNYESIANMFKEETTTEEVTTTTEPATTKAYITSSVTIGSAGDVLIHVPIYKNAKTADGYNFDNIFTYTSSVIEDCDYFVANLETTFAGTDRAYSGFPRFNTPDALASSLKKAGIDCLLTANNHTFDSNGAGVLRTQQTVKEQDFDYTGTRLDTSGKKYLMKSIKDINFGFVCYTYETPTYEGRKALNGLLVDETTAPLINSFNYEKLADFYREVKNQMSTMKKKGSDVIVMYIHWGDEYQLSPNNNQKAIAQKLCDMGIDVIIGGHPHVVEPVELITSSDGKHKTVCLYSVGNFVSNQRRAYMGLKTGHTEDGLIFTMTFSKYSDGKVTFDKVKAIPTWVHLYSENGKSVYNIVPLSDKLDSKAASLGLNKSSSGLSMAKESYKRTMALVSDGTAQCNKYLKSKSN